MSTTIATICPKIDIHSHIIYGVDDGSKDFDTTKDALKQIKKYNVEKIICTPHFDSLCDDRYKELINNYSFIKKGFKSHDVDIVLGFEFKLNYKNINILKNCNYNKKYIIVELDRNENLPEEVIIEQFNDVIDLGYKVILAHPEFYKNYRSIDFIKKLRDLDIVVQVDATSLIKGADLPTYRFSHKLLKKSLVDVVASDYHDNKKRSYECFDKAYHTVRNKYGFETANDLFYENPKIIVENF